MALGSFAALGSAHGDRAAPAALVVLQGIRAIDPAAGLDAIIDVVIENGRVTRLGAGAATAELLSAEQAMVVHGRELWAMPAFVDLHAHLREPGHEHKEDIRSGLAAAAAGGYAHVCAMPNTSPVNDDPAITKALLARAAAVGGPSLHPVAAITKGLAGRELTDMRALQQAGAVAFSDDGRCVMSAAIMRDALAQSRELGLAVIQHAEDHTLTEGALMHDGAVAKRLGLRGWPRAAEEVIVARDLVLLEHTGGRYHVAHASTAGTVRLVREAKARGLAVTAEVTPHHLTLTDEAVARPGNGGAVLDTCCKVCPPLREAHDLQALRAALADGTIDAIATDHAPHSPLEKDCDFARAAPGMTGLEIMVPVLLALVHDTTISLARFVDALTQAPARIAGIVAPSLRVGAVAELCVVDPKARAVLGASSQRSKSHNSPFLGRVSAGAVELIMANGLVVFRRPGIALGLGQAKGDAAP